MDFTLSYILVNLKRIYAGVITVCLIYFAYEANKKQPDLCTQTIFVTEGKVDFIQCDIFADSQRPVVMELSKNIVEAVWDYDKGDEVGYSVKYTSALNYIDANSSAGVWMRDRSRKVLKGTQKPLINDESSKVSLDPSKFKAMQKDSSRWIVTFELEREIETLAGPTSETYIIKITYVKGDAYAIYKAVSIDSDLLSRG